MLQHKVHLREGSLAEVGGILEQTSARRIFFVVDECAYEASGAAAILDPLLQSCSVTRFVGFEPNPKLHDVQRGVQLFRAIAPDLVIALGGGSAIDLGKLIGSLACQDASVRQIAAGEASIKDEGPPLVAISTTAGTGSEATHFAVVYIDGEKYSVAHPSLLPNYAIIDSRLTHSVPADVTATTGLDAFCQAIESIWAVGATDESVRYAAEAVRLAVDQLVPATQNPTPQSRQGMCRAAHLAGKAINISKTTLPHALSYSLTSNYGIPHGSAVAMTLGPVLAFNAQVSDVDCLDQRGPRHVLQRIALILELLGTESAAAACGTIERLVTAVGCPASLNEIGISTDDALHRIVGDVNVERLSNNPRRASGGDLVALLTPSPLDTHHDNRK